MTRAYGNSGSGGTTGNLGGRLYIDYSYTQNPSTNHSTVSWTVGFDYGDPNYWHNLSDGWLNSWANPGTIDGGTWSWSASGYYFGTTMPANPGGDNTLASGSFTVAHDSSGNATVWFNGTTKADSAAYTSTFYFSVVLPQIVYAPGAPTGLSVTGHTDSDPTTATLSWTAPTVVGGGLTGKAVRVATDASFTNLVYTDNYAAWSTSEALTGLPKGTTLYAIVDAQGAGDHWGPWSAAYSFTTGKTVPGTVTGPTLGSVTDTGMVLSWTAPADNGGEGVTYKVDRATNNTFSAGLVSTTGISATSLNVSGLASGTTYYFRVKATNSVGDSASWSTTVSATTVVNGPSAPTSVSYASLSQTGFQVSWGAPVSNGGSAITGYDIQRSADGSFSSPVTASPSSSPYTYSTLTPGTVYFVRVRAKNATANGAWSAAIQVRTYSEVHVGNGSAFGNTYVWVGNGTSWVPARVHVQP